MVMTEWKPSQKKWKERFAPISKRTIINNKLIIKEGGRWWSCLLAMARILGRHRLWLAFEPCSLTLPRHFVGVLEILPSSLNSEASSSENGAASQLWLHELLEYLPTNNYLGIEAVELRPGSGGTPLPSALVLAPRQLHVPSFPRREGFTKWPRPAENSPFYNAGWCQVCNPPASVSPALRLQIHTTRLSFVPVFSRNSSQ